MAQFGSEQESCRAKLSDYRGTAMYSSRNALRSSETGCIYSSTDDVEAVMWIFLDLLLGGLGQTDRTPAEESKRRMFLEGLADGKDEFCRSFFGADKQNLIEKQETNLQTLLSSAGGANARSLLINLPTYIISVIGEGLQFES